MQAFKKDNFEKSTGSPFPSYRTLSDFETESVRERLGRKLKLRKPADGLTLVQAVAGLGSVHFTRLAEDPAFNLREEMEAAGIKPSKSIYLNWYQYDQVDEMRFDDLADHFDDIWYPSSDDIDLFDDAMNWIVTIDHGGYGRLVKFEDGPTPVLTTTDMREATAKENGET
jgi:hypothetical protein